MLTSAELMILMNNMNRCDRCRASAKTYCKLDDLELYMCSHHSDEFCGRMMDEGWEVYSLDEDNADDLVGSKI